ncbi:CAP domain-containing protein [Haloferula sp. A504]|uniref:CAP domain-containing protein n=1 Tax=Haloferula sp. A504 TaxID=3373601 RepID=UPI0031C0E55C|nr:CAP domain-containing protein [Verrucomicrobiaceae bacterium E54]
MTTRLVILLACLAVPAAANLASDELLAAFQTRLERGESIDPICESLEDKDGDTLKALLADLNKAWPGVRDRYLKTLEDEAASVVGGGNDSRKRIRDLREEFLRIRNLDEAPMKPLLKSKSMPAVEELRQMLAPSAGEIVAKLPPATTKLRQAATQLARFRDAALDADYSATPSDSVEQLAAAEARIAAETGDLPRDGLRILEKNRRTAEDTGVPEDEARGVEEANLWRLLVGLNALEIDPKLCEAARDHSKDMAEQGFFAHESPVPGKATPWDRARNFGTTASGENIYAGSTQPESANKGWFFSPGHHKNLFGANHTRIGLGRHGSHWTQLFGK